MMYANYTCSASKQKNNNMKLLLIIILTLSVCHLQAQTETVEKTLALVQKNIKCCSLPISAASDKKANSILFDENENLIIRYSDPLNEGFETFEVFPKDKASFGIDTNKNNIRFYSDEKRINLIRFSTSESAQAVYNALKYLANYEKKEVKMFGDLNFQETVDVINIRLAKWSGKSNRVKILALNNGNIIVINKEKQTLRFNLFDLKDELVKKSEGIETLACDPRTHAPLAWINFKSVGGKIGFISLDCNTPNSELDNIRSAFIHLKSLCTKFAASNNPPYEALYFISRNALLNTKKKMLHGSLRAVDKIDDGDTTISVTSNGEGWLDKDSLPIGKWHFYSKNEGGKEYLFKFGTYLPTKPKMFKVTGIDSSDLAKKYHLSFYTLQQGQVQTVPFIKALAWNYLHPNGSFWKTVYYRNTEIPITTRIVMMDHENTESTSLVIELKKDRMDEWAERSGTGNKTP